MNLDNGHFSADGREYIINAPHTPRPWHNYLVNRVYLANITQYGSGASFYQPTGEGLRANVTEDPDGSGGPRAVYLRDNDTGEYWSLTGWPGCEPMEQWTCRIGLGYQVNTSRRSGIEASWRVFVPQTDDPCELWTVIVTNRSDRARRISAIPYVEMHLTGGSTLMDFISVLGGHYDPEHRAVFGINSCVKFPDMFKAVFASDSPVAGATVSRDEFMGHYRDCRNPLAVERGDVHNPQAGTEWLGASLRHELELAPGESATIHLVLGVVDSVESGKAMASKYLTDGAVGREYDALRDRAEGLVSRTTVATGDEQFDRWMNVWLKHQLAFVARWGRVIGRGFRDILQDTMAHRITEPDVARDCLLEVFSKQFPSGKCIRAWRLPTGILDLQDYADSPSWMIMALSMYLKETGDFSVLDESVPFLNPDDPYAESTSGASVWEHVVLAQRYLLAERGEHGLSKIYYGDWCDTLNGVGVRGRGESVMLSMQVKWGCDQLSELADRRGDEALAREMADASAQLAEAINTRAWDGEWYLRAFDDDAVPVGTSNPPAEDEGEGTIFLNPQSWALIAGVADDARAHSAIAAVREQLDTGYGKVLNAPAYTQLRPRIGQMSAMTPGFYENGSVYVHGNCFWLYALAVAGRGGEAWDAIRDILPDTPNKPNTDTEPFVIPNYYIGPNVERRRQRNLYLSGWRTGSAAWIYFTCLEEILGLRAEYDGLAIDPHLPEGWTNVSATRPFRGDTYRITLESTGQTGAAVRRITMNGKPVDGTVIPPVGDGGTHKVHVTLG
ncbi:MAG: GH36-type glycosyl hydrolase domain-containing protein [Phycisphaerae bacterium]